MTPEVYRVIMRRIRLLGILTMADLCAIFDTSDDTITRWVKRGDFPPPARVLGHLIWRTNKIEIFLDELTERVRLETERDQARREAKVQSLYGGPPHGKRP